MPRSNPCLLHWQEDSLPLSHKGSPKRTYGCLGERIVRDFGKVMYTPLYLEWMTNKDLLYSTWNSAQCSVPAWMGGEFGGEWIHVYVWLSPFSVHLKLPQNG